MRKHHVVAYLALALSACAHPRAIVLSPSQPEGVRVTGVGEASAPPDIARTRLGIEVRGAAAEQASEEAAQRMAALIAALKQLGIADKDLRTYNYSINFEQEQPPTPGGPGAPQPSAAVGPRGYYRVSNMLEVTVRDLKAIGRILQGAMAAGANNVWGVNFDLEDDAALVAQARQKAVADAQKSAADLAKLADVELGEVVSLAEGDQPSGYAPPTVYALRSESAEVPVERGEINVRYTVHVVYATKRK